MPFIPFVLLLAWLALSKTASFALGWATALFFGQIPGSKGRVLSIVSLVAVAWVIAGVGAFIPLAAGIVAQEAGLIGAASVEIEPLQLFGIAAGLILAPPAATAYAEWSELQRERSLQRWLRRIPVSYPVIGSLGISVLQMVLITPILTLRRMQQHRKLLQIPMVVREDAFDELADDLCRLLGKLVGEARREELTGPVSWPMRTIGLATKFLLGSVVRGDPLLIRGDVVDIAVHATNLTVTGPEKLAYQVRAAIEKELAFSAVFLTWSETSQHLEAKLKELHDRSNRDPRRLIGRLDELQTEIDAAELKNDEWNMLYRLRLQIERDAQMVEQGHDGADGAPSERVAEASFR